MCNYKKNYLSVRKNKDFQYLFKKGESIVTFAFVCYFKRNRIGKNRCGVVTSKKLGNAVKRNRSKRLIIEAFRHIEPQIRDLTDKRYDFIFVARHRLPEQKSTKIYSLMEKKLLALFKEKPKASK